ncbi:hypothetical protein [Bradyrhizobium sp. Ghvi]|uniref:hypothetical protein n=1 Tax=Bradyrhizobium sp. Ghvi TaxID=1855319 RepID=UPI0032DFBFDB
MKNIRPPRCRRWNASTINGNAKCGTGLIFNGHIVWNKVRMVKDPDTGKRLSRPNPRKEWQSIDVPQLRIIEHSLGSIRARPEAAACSNRSLD